MGLISNTLCIMEGAQHGYADKINPEKVGCRTIKTRLYQCVCTYAVILYTINP